MGLVALAGLLLLGLVVLALASRARGRRRALAVLLGGALATAPLVELGARYALDRGLVGPSKDTRAGDLYADDVQIEGFPPVPRHLLPAPDRRPAHDPTHARILVVGDSFAHGEGVRQSETFAARLADLVHPADGRPVQVVNLSQSSLDLRAEHDLFLGYGQAFVPDVVVWTFVMNDLGGGWVEGSPRYDDLVVDRAPASLTGSVALDLVASVVRGWRYEAAVVASYRASFRKDPLDEAERQLRDVALAVRAQGGRLIVVTFPLLWRLDDLPFADLHAEVLRRAEAVGAETLDLGPTFRGKDPATLWSTPRDHHPNAAAHALAADALAAAIGDRVPRAHPAPCVGGAGPAFLALCTSPGARSGLEVAREVTRPLSTSPMPAFLLTGFALAYTWSEAEALPPDERDAIRAELRRLAPR